MTSTWPRFTPCCALTLLLGLWCVTPGRSRASVPADFSETVLTSSLQTPTCMAMAPDGRIFIGQQGGAIRVVKNGALLPTAFTTLSVMTPGEQGLLGLAFDPAFTTNGHVYACYTTPSSFNRITRFTANGDVALVGSAVNLFDLDQNLSDFHVGGAIRFGADSMLYIAMGENASSNEAQNLTSLRGKISRIRRDGTIPTDNPFYAQTTGKNRAIWARGFRNPFTFAVQPGTGRMFVNDVGQDAFEEINDLAPGSNYGWPSVEGPGGAPTYVPPLHAYNHSNGCAIVGGAFFDPDTTRWPPQWRGRYFFSDLCAEEIRWINPASPATSQVLGITLAINPVGVALGVDGNLYYIARGDGSNTGVLVKIAYTASFAPSIGLHPQSVSIATGDSAEFTVTANGTPPLAYQWLRGNAPIGAANTPRYVLRDAVKADSGATFRCIVSNATGADTSDAAILSVIGSQSPLASIVTPPEGARFRGGTTLEFSGTASDPEDGTLPPAAYTWWIDLHHDQHLHPGLPETSGLASGSYGIAARNHIENNIWLRVNLRVVDSQGLTTTVYRDVLPDTTVLTLQTDPPGIPLVLDGGLIPTPLAFTSTIGVLRSFGAPGVQTANGKVWLFAGWSDATADTHDVATPATPTAYVARYVSSPEDTILALDWSGDYTHTGDALLREFNTPAELQVQLEGGATGARWSIPFSDVLPLMTAAADTLGVNGRFYGGLLMESYFGFFAYHEAEVWDRGALDALHSGGPTGTIGWDLRYWKKEDFRVGAHAPRVAFGPSSTLELLDYSGSFATPSLNSGQLRFVVRDGTQFWVSEDFAGPAASATADFVMTNPDARRWALYSPSPPKNFKFDLPAAAFVPHVFEDVTAIGYLHSNDNLTKPPGSARCGVTVSAVRARVRLSAATAVEPGIELPARDELELAVAPNPLGSRAAFGFALSKASRIRLNVFDVSGRLVARVIDEPRSAGLQRVNWDASRVGAGVYVAVLECDGRRAARRFAVVR
ncbi:MAG: hypothetical protein HOP12_04840 [Candidatus Eisenbacteria bacterium]|uniref:Ig-like domain-containing protein n=1 Tax=Eiseniibacteriota bacterium TaxID=2212470 RepID=A0A849SG94_UNCEI|nr:hypothetical protein [Candidatus Eisenbacteria bacterium]